MSITTGVLLLSAIVFSTAGQLLLKSAAHDLAGLGRFDFLVAALRDARVVSGLAAWAIWTACWLQVLRVTPLSKAYALTSLTYVIIRSRAFLSSANPSVDCTSEASF